MKTFGSFLARYPRCELDLYRIWSTDEAIRSICADHAEATEALLRWRAAGSRGTRQVLHYEALLRELEAEALARLEKPNDIRRS
ncbi:MAG: hypothetical protein CML66_20750 [Rhodobacteraceae bacterium]|nr:hypothetical protein [Paracoccaceae bacterium]MAY47220.1 hypothetical protein [Paracoccaceae bacterium]